MADQNKEEHILKEWTPLSDLFNKLPSRVQTGFFSQDVKLTCIDVIPEFIALGTNVGIVYWYDRKKKDMQRLRCENNNCTITALKIVSTVDFMVACGDKHGNVNIFQIPKCHPESLPESLKPKNKQVERYSVSEMHNGSITALEWSKNGMKLFSGDKNGLVIITEIDFYMHLCKSYEVLNEAYEVVQLSYYQQHLFISTLFRSIICHKQDKWKVTQIGKKDRKVLGKFGGLFFQNSYKPNDSTVYCTRPGLRIWEADILGSVQKTLLFKDILNKIPPEVQLINPISDSAKKVKPQKEAAFGILLPYSKNLLVTFSNDVVYILDPKELLVIATVSNLRGILSIATHGNELFILEGERSLIRISNKPESNIVTNHTIPIANTASPISASIKEITNKIQTSVIVSAIPPFIESAVANGLNVHIDATSIVNAEEAVESLRKSPIVMNSTMPDIKNIPVDDLQRKLEIYNKIGEQDYDDTILYKHSRRKKVGQEMVFSVSSVSSNSSEEKDYNITRPTLMNLSSVGILPDLKSPDTIQNEIEAKEKLLADILNFDKVVSIQTKEKNQQPVQAKSDFHESIQLNATQIHTHPSLNDCKDDKLESVNSPGTSDIRVLAQAYPYFCNKNPNGLSNNQLVSNPAVKSPNCNCNDNKSSKFNIRNNDANYIDVPDVVQFPHNWNIETPVALRQDSETSSDTLDGWEVV